MDFFEHQEQARRATTRLIVLMALAVIGITLALYFSLAGLMAWAEMEEMLDGPGSYGLWNLDLALMVGLGSPVIIGIGSLVRTLQLRGGGATLAASLGGRRLESGSATGAERRILNVVEEMAIASGTAVPPVYLLADEEGINAFAAGLSPQDAVIGVTQGTVDHLNREQLQGVIAHEFSHILNGDMRLNIKLIGIVSGILVIHGLGRFLMNVAARSSSVGRSRRRG